MDFDWSSIASGLNDLGFEFFAVLGGLGIFLFGIKFMGEALKSLSGSKLKFLIDKYTSNPVKGVFVGAAITALIQSSSGTTALAISLVRAGLMSLPQAIGIIMGANIGTTITAIMIGFKIGDYALPIIFVGAVIIMFSKKKKAHNVGALIFGFGSLFYGLDLMGSQLKLLAELPEFATFAVSLSHHPVLGVIVGASMTLLIQSSSATIGILQSLYGSGALDLHASLPILFGDNIGTTITALLAAIGGSVVAKRAAGAHITFNLIGTIIFLTILPIFQLYVEWGAAHFGLNPEMQIAFAHASFNITTTILLLPFVKQLEWIVTKVIPSNKNEIKIDALVLDTNLVETYPEGALELTKNGIARMLEVSGHALNGTLQYFETKNDKYKESVLSFEEIIDDQEMKLAHYLRSISHTEMNDHSRNKQNIYFQMIKDVERIGDHCENLVEQFEMIFDARDKISGEAKVELTEMIKLAQKAVNLTHESLETLSFDACQEVIMVEEKIDALRDKARLNHIERFKNNECTSSLSSTIFVDILTDIERIGDHCNNVVNFILDKENYFTNN